MDTSRLSIKKKDTVAIFIYDNDTFFTVPTELPQQQQQQQSKR